MAITEPFRGLRAPRRMRLLPKHWLFSNTPRVATASTTIYSMLETAKEHGLNPFAYLTWLLEQPPQLASLTDVEALDRLLPWSDSLPPVCRLEHP